MSDFKPKMHQIRYPSGRGESKKAELRHLRIKRRSAPAPSSFTDHKFSLIIQRHSSDSIKLW